VRLREGKRGATWYAKYSGLVRLPDGHVAIKQTETRIGSAWTGTGRPPTGTYTRRSAQAWLDAKLTDLRRGIGIAAVGDSASFADAEWYRHGCLEGAWKPSIRRDYRSALSVHLGVDLDPETGAVVAARAPFGDMPLEDITTDTIERWRAGALKPYADANGVQRVKLPRRTAVHALGQRTTSASSAFAVCRRFSASAQTAERGPYSRPGEISSPGCAGRQCSTIAPGSACSSRASSRV